MNADTISKFELYSLTQPRPRDLAHLVLVQAAIELEAHTPILTFGRRTASELARLRESDPYDRAREIGMWERRCHDGGHG